MLVQYRNLLLIIFAAFLEKYMDSPVIKLLIQFSFRKITIEHNDMSVAFWHILYCNYVVMLLWRSIHSAAIEDNQVTIMA